MKNVHTDGYNRRIRGEKAEKCMADQIQGG